MEEILESVPASVTREMNEGFTAPYSEHEVKTALYHMFPTKVLGVDGFPAHFFQRNWDLCGVEVTTAVL
jgi:hypothetical protein